MPLKTKEQYFESIRQAGHMVYLFGERVTDPVAHPIIRPSLNSVAETYALAAQEEYRDLLTATSALTGDKISRFCHLHQKPDDLVQKVKMLRLLGQKTASCFQRCVGLDAINALYSTTYELDAAHGTNYHARFVEYLKYVEQHDLTLNGAMTDPKGDRALPPHAQEDPDLYLRIVGENGDGIVVRGAKAHQTGAVASHEHLVMPTAALSKEDRDYAVSFAVPSGSPGVLIIYGRQSSDTRRLECEADIDLGNADYGGHEALVVFNDVFVPWERVFLCREYDFAGLLVERFAGYHRQSYGGCKVGVGDVLIGAAALAADYNGVGGARHIKDKLIEMTHLNETLYSCGLACSTEGKQTPAGNYLVDLLLANVCKQNVTRFPYEVARLAEDIAGGLLATAPSEQDLRHPEVGPLIAKYLRGKRGSSTKERLRVLRLIENLTLGSGAAAYRTESMHGAGSPEAQRIMIARQGKISEKKKLAKKIAGVREEQDGGAL